MRQHHQSVGEARNVPKVHLRAKWRTLAVEDSRAKAGHRLVPALARSQRGARLEKALQVTSTRAQHRNGGQTLGEGRGECPIQRAQVSAASRVSDGVQ